LNTPTLYHQLYTPANRVTGAIDYSWILDAATVHFHLDGNWNDGQYSSTGDVNSGTKDASGNTIYLPQLKSQAGTIYNARISVGDIRLASSGAELQVAFWVRNLFNSNLMIARSGNYSLPQSSITASFIDPRTFGATLSARF